MSNIVLTKVEFNRNVKDYAFKPKLSVIKRNKLVSLIEQTCEDCGLYKCGEDKQEYILEKLLINNHICYIDKSNMVAVEVLNTEHLTISSVSKDIYNAYEYAKKLDKAFCDKLHFMYDDKLGFLTSDITKLGTGMQVSVKLLLPALTKLEALNMLPKSQDRLRFKITNLGNSVYLITSGASLGYSEKEICKLTSEYIDTILKYESEGCKQLFNQSQDDVIDKSLRAKAILSSCIKISPEELYVLVGNILINKELADTVDIKGMLNSIDYLTSKDERNKLLATEIKKYIK